VPTHSVSNGALFICLKQMTVIRAS
jgi:hypothetical protein